MKFEYILKWIAKNKEDELDKVLAKVPQIEIRDTLEKLKRYKYAKYKLTKVAIDKLKKKRGW
jgi:hypothetical protein